MFEKELAAVDSVASIDAGSFTQHYFKPLQPLVIRDLAASWPAMKKWTTDFLRDVHGGNEVRVYDASFVSPGRNYMSSPGTLTMAEYIEQITGRTRDLRMFLYNIASAIPELVDDIVFPDLVDGLSRRFVFMFFGCRGSVTQMHFDIDMSHVFHTAIRGRKTVYLFPYREGKHLHRYPFTCRSYVDMASPDYQRFPGLKKVRGYRLVLNAGETLYIPSGYWHHFVYDEPGYSVSLRRSHHTWPGRLHGLYNLFIMSPLDRVMNTLTPGAWFAWKERLARKKVV